MSFRKELELIDVSGEGADDKLLVEEMANKILNDLNYEDSLKNGIKQIITVNGEYNCFVVEDATAVKNDVMQGELLGKLSEEYGGYTTFFTKGKEKNVVATKSGHFTYAVENFKKAKGGKSYVLELSRFSKGSDIIIGRIFLDEYEFYCKYRDKIECLVRKERNVMEIEAQQIEDDKKRTADKLLKTQESTLEDIEELLEYLDDLLVKGKLPEYATLRELRDDLKILDGQKDNLIDIKSIKDYNYHFENAYYKSKRNLNLDSQIEGEMLGILRRFLELLEESEEDVNIKLDKIKATGSDNRFEIEFVQQVKLLDDVVTKVQSKFIKEKEIDVKQLGEVENFANLFSAQKDRIKQKEFLKRSKDTVETIWKEYSLQDDKVSSLEKSLKRVLKSFYVIFGKSEQEISEIFAKQQKEESEREFAKKIAEQTGIIKKLTLKIRELEIAVANREKEKIEIMHNIEDLLKELVNQKDIIKDKTEIESGKAIFDAIIKDCKKYKILSASEKLRVQEISNGFVEICGTTKKGFFRK